jgi:hypothetical protein
MPLRCGSRECEAARDKVITGADPTLKSWDNLIDGWENIYVPPAWAKVDWIELLSYMG